MLVGVAVGVAVGGLLADADGVGDGELDGVGGSELGVAGAVTVEEGSGELEGNGVPLAEGWLVSDADISTGVAGGGAAASAIPAAIAAMPPMAPSPSSTGVQLAAGFGPDSGLSAVTGCLPVVPPQPPAGSSAPMVATRAAALERRSQARGPMAAEIFRGRNDADRRRFSARHMGPRAPGSPGLT